MAPYQHFWGPVIAGTLVTISVFVLSLALMFGCSVGVYNPSKTLSLGGGAAVWICITSAIAYYLGGMVSSTLAAPTRIGWIRGFSLWGLSVPLITIIGAFVASGAGLAYGLNTAHLTEQVTNQTGVAHLHAGNLFVNYGGAWTVFIALLIGVFCAIFGAISPSSHVVAAYDEPTSV
jgi:hypothetical protein